MPQCAAEDTARVGGRGAAPEAQPPPGDDAAGFTRGDKPRESPRGTRPPRNCSSHAHSKRRQPGLYRPRASLGERWAESVRGVVASSWWLESVRVESVLDGILAVLA